MRWGLSSAAKKSGDDGLRSASDSSLLRTVASYASGNTLAMMLNLTAGLLAARVVEPAVLGLFQGFALILGYIPFLHLGICNGLGRELPYQIGRGEAERARLMAAVTQAWTLVLAALSALPLAGLGLWAATHGQWIAAAGWATVAANAALFFFVTSYLEITYRTTSDFSHLAAANVMRAVAALILVAAVWAFGFYGLCLRSLGVALVGLVMLWRWRPLRTGPRLDPRVFWELARVGAPIFVVGQVYAWWPVLDRTLVLAALGAEGLGLYSLAVMILPAALLLPKAVNQIVYPRMTEQYGREVAIAPLVRFVVPPVLMLAGIMAVVTVAGWLLLPAVVRMLLPAYSGGIPAARWTLILAFLFSFQPANTIFVTVKKQLPYLVAIVSGIVGYLVALPMLLGGSMQLVAFPQAMICGRVVFLIVCYGFLAVLLRQDARPAAEPLAGGN